MAEATSNMETDLPKLINTFSNLSLTISSLTEIITANGTMPASLLPILTEAQNWLEKASDIASRVLRKLPEIKPLQVSIEALTKDLQLAKAELDEKTKFHTDEMQKNQKYVADLEKRHTETSSGFEARLRHAASEVERLRDDASEVDRLRGVESEFKRLQDVTSKVERELEEAKLEIVKLGAEASKHERDLDSGSLQTKQSKAKYEGRITALNKQIEDQTSVLAEKDATIARLQLERDGFETRKNEYKRNYLFYRETFEEMEKAQSDEATPDSSGPAAEPITSGEKRMTLRPQRSRQILTSHPSVRKRLHDDATEDHNPRRIRITHPAVRKRLYDALENESESGASKKSSTAQFGVDAEEEDSFQYAGTNQSVPEVARQDQEVTFVETANAVTSEQQVASMKTANTNTVTSEQEVTFVESAEAGTSEKDLSTQIWSMFVLPLDLEEHEKAVLRDQVRDLCEKKQNSFEDVVAAIDHHVVGRFDRTPPEPRPCLMAQGMAQSCGAGGSRMTRNSCQYCKKKPDQRICCWARYVNGVGSGYPPRVDGRISASSKDWNRTVAEPLTVENNGRSVRWQLIRRKAHYQDPDY